MLGFYKVFFTFCAVLVAGCVAFAFVALADYLGWGDQW